MSLPYDQQAALEAVIGALYHLQSPPGPYGKRYYSLIFRDLPDREEYPDYYLIIKEPRALNDISVSCPASPPPAPASREGTSQLTPVPPSPFTPPLNRRVYGMGGIGHHKEWHTISSESGRTRGSTINKAVKFTQMQTRSR